MKKRVFTKLISLILTSAVVLSFSGFLYADETEGLIPNDIQLEDFTIENDVVTDIDFDNDEAAEQYINRKMPDKKRPINIKYDYASFLQGYDRDLYDLILPYISEIASGKRTNTDITIPKTEFAVVFSNTELGVENFNDLSDAELSALAQANNPVNFTKIIEALVDACPYELYWFDREANCRVGYGIGRSSTSLVLLNYKIIFRVSAEYQDGNETTVNNKFGKAVEKAASNVRSIINSYAALSDYDKLLAYNDKICQLTEYNHPAVDNPETLYGNPWQLIWIFDDDPNTKVVCEGYAKGFQYLCDNSVFRSDEVYALPAKGYLGSAGHEWNIVHMDDGKNYLVDTTNSDGHLKDGHYTRFFLVGAKSGSVTNGYTIQYVDDYGYTRSLTFTYFDSTVDFYGQSLLKLESTAYDPYIPRTISISHSTGGTVETDAPDDWAYAGNLVNIRTHEAEGYEVEYITVNGKKISGESFYMPGRDVELYVKYKKVDYTLTINSPVGGTASLTATKANIGDSIKVNYSPDTGYELDKIKVNGTAINGNTFTMPGSNVDVEVSFKKTIYSISVVSPTNGKISLSAMTATYGDKITVTATPNTGYAVDQIKVDGSPIDGNTFTMPAKGVTVAVTFKKVDYTISVSSATGGTAVASKTKANYNDKITVTVTPDTGYELDKITVNGTAINGNTFNMPASNVNVNVTFKKTVYKVTVGTIANGSVEVSAATATYGDKITVTATPDEGYEIDQIKVNGSAISGKTFNMPAEAVTAVATFTKIVYKITVNCGVGGTVDCSKTTATMGETFNVSITPATGYKIKDIVVNNIQIHLDAFTIEMPAENIDISATFEKIDYEVSINTPENGSATVSKATANYGDKITVTATPETGYEIDSIKVNGTVIDGTTFNMPAENVAVEVTFKKAVYKISLTASEGGTAVLSKTEGNYGDEITVDVNVEDGYHLVAIKVNGEKIDGNTFTLPDKNTSVEVLIEKDTYNVNVASATNGKVTVSKTSCAPGTEVKVTVTADKNYVLDKLIYTPEGGKAVDITSSKKFTMPAKNVTVKATFKSSLNPSLKLDKTSANVVCGDKLTLKATLKDSTAKISWKSSDTKIATVDSNGKITAKQAGKVTITASAAGLSAKCTVQVLFKDVTDSKDFWYEPTYYLVGKGIVKGYDNQTLFKPANECTRAQMVTFLWRLAGSPAPKSTKTDFTDIKKTDYYYNAVLWAVEKGITTGTSKTTFGPSNVCTRAQTVTFLYRMAGSPSTGSAKNPFKDVKSSDFFYKPVIWAYKNKIVAGSSDGTFNPQGKCLRRQMVTFLYKYDKYINK